MARYRRRLTSILLVVAVIAGMVLPVTAFGAPPAAPADTPKKADRSVPVRPLGGLLPGPTGISGKVTNAGGTPLQGIWAILYTPDYDWITSKQTDASGVYMFSGLQNGQYKVQFSDDAGNYQEAWYNGADNFYDADVITAYSVPEAGGNGGATNINAILYPYGTGQSAGTGQIRGTVKEREAPNNTLAKIRVVLEDADGPIAEVITQPNGYYEFNGLEYGNYYVKYMDPLYGEYATEYFRDAWFTEDAEPLPIDAGHAWWQIDKFVTYEPSDILVSDAGYDDFASILDGMMWNYRLIDAEEFADPSLGVDPVNYPLDPKDYSVFFANCSLGTNGVSDGAAAAVKKWVETDGGSLYASDWAYSIVEKAWPDKIAFNADPKSGKAGDVTADIWDEGLAWWMNPDDPPWTVDLSYDLDQWALPIVTADDVWDLLYGVAPGETEESPLASYFDAGEGSVLFTTFHNEAQISDTQWSLLEYFALLPYLDDYVDGMDEYADSQLPGYEEDQEWLGTINEGDTSPSHEFDTGVGSTAILIDGSEDATMKVEITAPDGTRVYGEAKGGDTTPTVVRIPRGAKSAPVAAGLKSMPRAAATPTGMWSIKINGLDVNDANAPYAVKVYTSGNMVSVAGGTRIETAIKASQDGVRLAADTVVIATAFNFPDALGGSSLAGALRRPAAADEQGLAAGSGRDRDQAPRREEGGHPRVRGGGRHRRSRPGSPRSWAEPANVQRIGGADRYATAALIAAETVRAWPSAASTAPCLVATGENFPDALAASPLAAAKGRPILLTRGAALPAVTEARSRVGREERGHARQPRGRLRAVSRRRIKTKATTVPSGRRQPLPDGDRGRQRGDRGGPDVERHGHGDRDELPGRPGRRRHVRQARLRHAADRPEHPDARRQDGADDEQGVDRNRALPWIDQRAQPGRA